MDNIYNSHSVDIALTPASVFRFTGCQVDTANQISSEFESRL